VYLGNNYVFIFQLNISDVHIRYEDNLVLEEKYFTFGLVIESLVAQSCNENWDPGCSSGQFSHKTFQLSNLSVYWEDCTSADLIGSKEPSEFIVRLIIEGLRVGKLGPKLRIMLILFIFQNEMSKASSRGSVFILNPVSGKANLKKNRSSGPLRSRSTPRYVCDVMFDDFPISLSDVSKWPVLHIPSYFMDLFPILYR